jgi:non-ribosomal peptide synthetase component F
VIKQSAAVERSPYERLEGRGLAPANVFIKFKKEEVEQSIQQRFERMVSLYPRRTAVKTQDETLTYEELNNRVNRIAGTLLECRGSKAEPIVLFLEKGAAAIASILGVLKAGKIYVPISVSTPRKRMESMLEDCQSPVILTNGKNLPAIDESPRASALLINVDEINYGLPAENPRASVSPDALAYILYTSGSTGRPKGLVQNHRNVLHDTLSYTNTLHRSSAETGGDTGEVFPPDGNVRGVQERRSRAIDP